MSSLKSLLYSPLGKETIYPITYAPDFLFPIPRDQAREDLYLPKPLPFQGVDIWTGYELSWLNPKGKPHVAIARFYFPFDSENLIESKSFKLYLNSFNQSYFASFEEVQQTLEKDLSLVARGEVKVEIILPSQFSNEKIIQFPGICLDDLDVSIETYHPNCSTLQTNSSLVQETLYTHLLRSSCPVTGQPDWASLLIHYEGHQINQEGLLKYLISFRKHSGFHEQCVEKIYGDIYYYCSPTKLTVYARYTRRGGIEINPFRSNFELPPPLCSRLAQQ